ncbi:MAG: hypothetical protein ABIT76_04110 [Chthoniobacterales bacterium]
MKITLIICLLMASFLFTGCETVVESRRPVRVYDRPAYYESGPRRGYYDNDYRHHDRVYERDVIINNRRDVIVREQPRVYNRRTRVVVAPQRTSRTIVRRDAPRDDDRKRDSDRKKKHRDHDDDHR